MKYYIVINNKWDIKGYEVKHVIARYLSGFGHEYYEVLGDIKVEESNDS